MYYRQVLYVFRQVLYVLRIQAGTLCIQSTLSIQAGTVCIQTHTLCIQTDTLCNQSSTVCIQTGTLCIQTGTLTADGLDFWVVMPVSNGRLDSPVHDPTQLLPHDPIVVAMATCHSLTLIGGELSGDPLDVSMFNSINWVSSLHWIIIVIVIFICSGYNLSADTMMNT